MLSVGGATYHFNNINYDNIFNLMLDIGADGIDIDWEDPAGAAAADKLGPIINNFRKSIGSSNLLCMAAFSVGAYGSGAFSNATPLSQNTGMCIKGLQSNGNQLDWINIMSYDASPVYDPLVAFAAYRSYYSGPLMLGCEVPPEAWGGHVLNLDEVKTYCKCVSSDSVSSNGIFVWSYQKTGTPSCSDIINTAVQNLDTSSIKPTPTPTPKPPTPIPNNNTWIQGKTYNIGEKVSYNNNTYVCKNTNYSLIPPGTIIWSLDTPTPKPIPTPVPKPNPTPIPNPENISKWNTNISYSAGTIVLYNQNKYKCLQSHTSLGNWFPDVTPALWQQI